MNRRQKIIVSVTGIFIVLLILIGLTYGYFLTRITGNGNPTSISVTTANLELVYGDGTTSILTSSTPIEPGKFSSSKDFTVTNNGNALTDYAVTLEDFSITYANDTVIDGVSIKAGTVTKMEYPSDMKMEITCTIESDDETRDGQPCGNVDGTLPTENSILLTNSIEVDDIHNYVLTLTYVESGTDQSADMNKTIKGKIDIIDPKSTIDIEGIVYTYAEGDYIEINSTPIKSEIVEDRFMLIGVEPGEHTIYLKYKDSDGNIQTRWSLPLIIKKDEENSVSGNTIIFNDLSRVASIEIDVDDYLYIDRNIRNFSNNSLAYKLLEKSKNVTNQENAEGLAIYSKNPKTTPGLVKNNNNESTLSETEDFYGTSYYYRGNIKDNYVSFAGYLWRILRVQGDGTIKLVISNYDYNKNDIINDTYLKYISNTDWCVDNTYRLEYDGEYKIYLSLDRINDGTPSLKCDFVAENNSTSVKRKKNYGLLTIDEVAFAGLKYNSDLNYNFLSGFGKEYYLADSYEYDNLNFERYYYAILKDTLKNENEYSEIETDRIVIAIKPETPASVDYNSIYSPGTYNNPYILG